MPRLPSLSLRLLALALVLGPAQAQVVARPDRTGDTIRLLLPAAAGALTLAREDREGLGQLALTVALSEGTTAVLKSTLDRPRPDGSGHGFPSGHASLSFASAAYVHQRYGLAWAAPLYGAAAVAARSRVRTGHHFTRDVLAGGLIGVGAAFVATTPERGLQVGVGVAPGGLSLQLATAF
jgi:membrane-associated phospholipid phosphatase